MTPRSRADPPGYNKNCRYFLTTKPIPSHAIMVWGHALAPWRTKWGRNVTYRWVDCDRAAVSQRYDHIAKFIPFFDWLFFLPPDLRKKAVLRLGLSRGDSVLEIGCGTGRNFSYLQDAVGPTGKIYGIDISPGMLAKAQEQRDSNRWHNIELTQCDAVEYTAPEQLDGVLFSLSYNTMPHHRAVLERAWDQLRPGGHLVIMDAKLPPGLGGRLILPFSLWLMKHTMLGNPLIRPWEELAAIAEHFDMQERLFNSYYICRGMKPVASVTARPRIADDGTAHDIADHIAHHIAAE
jgi:demethylmenaquinone methyltransferase/2-methoxy-6-polyprenyl-1,4-benzoquinol methylase